MSRGSLGTLAEVSKFRVEREDGSSVEFEQPLARRTVSAAEHREREAQKPADPVSAHNDESRQDYLEALLARWESTNDDVEVMFDVSSDDAPPLDLQPFREQLESRWDVVRAREAALAPSRRSLLQAIEAAGGTVLDTRWLANQVFAKISGGKIREVSRAPGVIGWSGNSYEGGPSQQYDGIDYRNSTAAARFLNLNQRGCRLGTGSCWRVMVAEWLTGEHSGVSYQNRIAGTHFGWRRAGTSTSRVLLQRNCTLSGCPDEAGTSPTVETHGQIVASVIGASIEGAQDPGQADDVARRERSGLAPAVDILYSRVNSCSSLNLALQVALFNGAYVFNSSNWFGIGTPPPHTQNSDCGGINAALRAYTNFEGVFVSASGNNNIVEYPGIRPESVTVGGLDTSDDSVPYGSTVLRGSSGQGTIDVVVNGSTFTGAQRPVFLAAPGNVRLMPAIPLASYSGNLGGTSFAAPAVAGVAALFMDQFGTPVNGRILHAALLSMGDGWQGAGTGVHVSGTSASCGAGRVRALRPNFWGYRWFSVSQGQEVCWDVANGDVLTAYSGWKWGLTWEETDLNQAADIDLYVRDIASGATLFSQSDRAIHNRIRLNAAQVSGRRLRACVYGFHVPSGQTRTVYTTDFVHSHPGD